METKTELNQEKFDVKNKLKYAKIDKDRLKKSKVKIKEKIEKAKLIKDFTNPIK